MVRECREHMEQLQSGKYIFMHIQYGGVRSTTLASRRTARGTCRIEAAATWACSYHVRLAVKMSFMIFSRHLPF